MTTKELKDSLRKGRYAWPGGYEKIYITDDGAILCDPCVRKEFAQIIRAIKYGYRDGWRVGGVDTVEEADERIVCDHCSEIINEYDRTENWS
jgi:hypothetical protein